MNQDLKQRYEDLSLHQHCYQGHYDHVATFIANNHKLELDQDGRSLLHWACSGNNLSLVLLLLPKCSPEAKDDNGLTPFMIACMIGSLPIVEAIFNYNNSINVNQSNNDDRTALFYACSKNHIDIVRFLISSGAHVNHQDKLGQTPLFRAVVSGNQNMVELLLEHNANVQHLDGHNDTALHIAMEQEYGDIAVLLIQKGADIHVKNKDGKEPIDMTMNTKVLEFVAREMKLL